MIGRVLFKIKPDVAREIMDMVTPGEETDFNRIFNYYARFDLNRPVRYNAVNLRRIFTAVMLRLYYPCVLEKAVFEPIKSEKGHFVKNIAACFNCHSQAITKNIREVVVLYKAYEDFEKKVDEMLVMLKYSE